MLHNQTPSKEGTPDDIHKVEYSEVNTSTEITQGWYVCYSVAIIFIDHGKSTSLDTKPLGAKWWGGTVYKC